MFILDTHQNTVTSGVPQLDNKSLIEAGKIWKQKGDNVQENTRSIKPKAEKRDAKFPDPGKPALTLGAPFCQKVKSNTTLK